ncbi:hypothetical protein F66182_9974 [Fusarium sp. NRRL 66182]|nr:hypothetical protein F66182_9974 [Fusarium sp. NRRL 66182]
MRLIIEPDALTTSAYVVRHIIDRITTFQPTLEKPFILGLPTGSSPVAVYKFLIEAYEAGRISFEHVVTFNMDEYTGIPRSHPQSYRDFMHRNLFSRLDIKPENINILNGNAPDLEEECSRYEAKIREVGGIELFFGGVGSDGHVAFNEPGSSLASRTRVKTLNMDTVRANSRFFGGSIHNVPRTALTVGVQTIMDIPSFVTRLPNGSEKGVCLAIDLGGTNLRVCSVDLHGNSRLSVAQYKAAIPREVMAASSYTTLFAFIAQHTELFMRKHTPGILQRWKDVLRAEAGRGSGRSKREYHYPLGFSFSFSVAQRSINEGTLRYWSKSFSIDDAVGRDPCAMLQEALDNRSLPLTVTALVNDAVCTLAARAYCAPLQGKTLLGAVFGTGTNGAYMEDMSKIQKLRLKSPTAIASQDQCMALNTEWGGFDRDLEVLPVTEYDEELDRDSVHPNDQHYEKRISGLYLGELLRRAMLRAVERGVLTLDEPPTSRLHEPYSIDSSFLSKVLQDESEGLDGAKQHIAQVLGSRMPTTVEAHSIKMVCEAITKRAAPSLSRGSCRRSDTVEEAA